MHPFVIYNQKISAFEKANLSAVSTAALYARGIFTTVAIYNRKPFLWEKHWRRLVENARKISLDLTRFTEETVRNSFVKIVEKNNFKNGRARITFFDSSASAIWQEKQFPETNFLIQTADFCPIKKKLKLIASPFQINSTSPLSGIKSCNYLENILALESARAEHFDEAIRINERGEVVSACMANVFWKRGKKIFTPRLETGCLAGTTRDLVMENFSVEEVTAQLDDLKNADKIFLTSAGLGIVKAKFFGE